MNRLILVGNGFDLAHDLKTSYRDFIDDFWYNQLQEISFNSLMYEFSNDYFEIKSHADEGFFLQQSPNYKSLIRNSINANAYIKFKNNFLKLITDNCYTNWVDIENEYYNELKKDNINIDELNKNFSEVKELLITYLNKIKNSSERKKSINKHIYSLVNANDLSAETRAKIIEEIHKSLKNVPSTELSESLVLQMLKRNFESKDGPPIDTFFQDLNRYDKESIKSMFPFLKVSKQLILNFNYTTTAGNYTDYNYISKIAIHGELNSSENPIIFGFGDDVDKKYQEFEDKNDNRYLENFKSIAYLQTENYKKLLEFIDSDDYQIFIFGHSCGISDRTMLNTIFEHDNCKSVKPFYHRREEGSDNYTEIIQNISRNFNNKKKFRDRVVNKTYCEPLT